MRSCILFLCVVCGCNPANVEEPNKPTPVSPHLGSEALFHAHARAGTLFQSATSHEFLQKGWGKDYHRLIRSKWKANNNAGLSLTLREIQGHTYRVGQNFDCMAILTNIGENPSRVNTGGSCRMTHALGIIVIPPDGGLGLGLCRGLDGGPHCFCEPRFENLDPRQSISLATGFASDAAIIWKLDKAGEYLVIGTYTLPGDQEAQCSFSEPLTILVKDKE